MRIWRFWFNTLILSSQHNPPRFVELLMLLLAMALLGIWGLLQSWPYLVLCLSYVVGASISILVREALTPSSQSQLTQVTVALLLATSLYYSFTELSDLISLR